MNEKIGNAAKPPAGGLLRPSQAGKWMALTAAFLGWLFDGFEMGMFPLVGRPALKELVEPLVRDANPGLSLEITNALVKQATDRWFGVIMAVFLVGAATGGVVFGWLGDRLGRVRAMSLSIFTYAIFTGLCGFATEAWHIAVLRFIASLGMGGEWSLGVALVTELWSDKSRAVIAGLIGAAANIGFLLVGLLSLVLLSVIDGARDLLLNIGLGEKAVEHLLSNQAWRLMMIAGALPALLIFFIRLFVPESEKWQHERDKGATSHWATKDLLGVLVGCAGAGLVVALWSPLYEMFALRLGFEPTSGTATGLRVAGTIVGVAIALFGYMYPVRRYLFRAEAAGAVSAANRATNLRRLFLGASLTGVALLGTWGSIQWIPSWVLQLEPDPAKHAKEYAQIASACGAIVATFAAALLAGRFGRRITFSLMCLASFATVVLLFQTNTQFDWKLLACIFLAGGVTASFYGFFPLYLPELFPTSVRATSQGFAFNFGRVLAAIGTLQTATLIQLFDGNFAMAATVLGTIYLIGIFIIWLGPETKGQPLPE